MEYPPPERGIQHNQCTSGKNIRNPSFIKNLQIFHKGHENTFADMYVTPNVLAMTLQI